MLVAVIGGSVEKCRMHIAQFLHLRNRCSFCQNGFFRFHNFRGFHSLKFRRKILSDRFQAFPFTQSFQIGFQFFLFCRFVYSFPCLSPFHFCCSVNYAFLQITRLSTLCVSPNFASLQITRLSTLCVSPNYASLQRCYPSSSRKSSSGVVMGPIP